MRLEVITERDELVVRRMILEAGEAGRRWPPFIVTTRPRNHSRGAEGDQGIGR